jgi:hypothetical protein
MPRGANFSREELDSFLDIVEDILPLSTTQWESVVETHSARYPDKGRTVDGLKRKFKELHIKRIPTGDPHCPPAVRRAKQLRNAIIELMDGSDLNSPARGTRMDAVGMGLVVLMTMLIIKNTKIQVLKMLLPRGLLTVRMHPRGTNKRLGYLLHPQDKEGQRLEDGKRDISSTANSSNNRHRTSTHNTPILRPRNCQRENSPEDPGDRVGNVMAMTMMSQAQREERHQEFRLQVEMQRQQMQNQQNMMAMIMMSMMGRNASGSVPNDCIVNMFAGSSSTEQRND